MVLYFCRNPNKESLESTPYGDEREWPVFTIPELQYKELAVNVSSGNGLRADECHFWNEYLVQLTTFSGKPINTADFLVLVTRLPAGCTRRDIIVYKIVAYMFILQLLL